MKKVKKTNKQTNKKDKTFRASKAETAVPRDKFRLTIHALAKNDVITKSRPMNVERNEEPTPNSRQCLFFVK